MGLLDFAGSLIQTFANRRSQNRQNEFNAQQAELNRQFQSQEAQIARDWQEQQYNLYSSPSAMVRQYQDAGLNPALMYGQNLQSSTGSSPAPSGSMASGSPLGAGMPTGNIVDSIAGLAKLKAEINNINADTDAKRAQAIKLGSDVNLNNKQIENISQQIKESIARENTEYSKRDLNQVLQATESIKQENMSVEQYILKFEQEYIRKHGRKPDQPALNILLDYLSPYLEVGSDFVNDSAKISKKGYNLVKSLFGL
ncbi:MAG: hypothetical protein IKK18_01995 [Clostridia bacterium]|nr:hypothetical protein [Clostridia bacterium]